jgi:hypothetical protein
MHIDVDWDGSAMLKSGDCFTERREGKAYDIVAKQRKRVQGCPRT